MDVGEQQHAGDGEREGEEVAPGARADRRDGDRAGELDRDGGAERQPVDREVEREVHARERRAERPDEQEPPAGPAGAPRPPPGDEGDRGARRPQPGEPGRGHRREEQDRDRRPDVLRDRAEDEERLRRDAVAEPPQSRLAMTCLICV
jgi:hypothetical protein